MNKEPSELKNKFKKDEQKIIEANLAYLLRCRRSPYHLNFLNNFDF